MKMDRKAIGIIMLGMMSMMVLASCGGKADAESAQSSTEKNQQEESAASGSKSGFDVVGTLENYGSGDDLHFELKDAQKSFINEHLQLFPSTHENLDELSGYIDNSLDYAHMNKNPSAAVGKFALIDGLYVNQIFEHQLDGGGEYDYLTRINASDADMNLYQIFYMGKSTPLIEGDIARVVAMPIANSDYQNLSGTTKLTLVMFASLAEDSTRSEITYGYFDANASAQSGAQNSLVDTNVPVQYETQVNETVTDALEDDIDWTYIIPDSDTRYLERSIDLSGLSQYELRLARNEIYARHGRKFNDPSLQSYFNGKGWYVPTTEADQFNDSCLNAYEKANLALIKDVEDHGV